MSGLFLSPVLVIYPLSKLNDLKSLLKSSVILHLELHLYHRALYLSLFIILAFVLRCRPGLGVRPGLPICFGGSPFSTPEHNHLRLSSIALFQFLHLHPINVLGLFLIDTWSLPSVMSYYPPYQGAPGYPPPQQSYPPQQQYPYALRLVFPSF